MRTFANHLEQTGFRGPGFDRIRLIAALVVVLHHTSFYSMDDIADDLLSSATGGAVSFGRLAVDIFFITSGVLVAPGLLRSGDIITFVCNRALRIMPALFVVVTATAFVVGPILTHLTVAQYFSNPDTYLYLKNITTRAARYLPGVEDNSGLPLIVNGALWTIYFEVLSYAALVLLFATGIVRNAQALIAAFVLVYAVYLYSYLFPANPLGIRDTILIFCQLFIYFLGGVCISAFPKAIPHDGRLAFVLFALTLLAMPLGLTLYVWPFTLSYLVTYLGYSTFLGGVKIERDLSYGVYLIHSVIIAFFALTFPQIDRFAIVAPIIIAITLLLAFLSWTFIEEPCLKRKRLVSDTVHRLLGLRWPRQSRP